MPDDGGPAVNLSPESDANPWWRLYEARGSVEVYHVDLSGDTDREPVAQGWLSSQERLRSERFVYPGPRRRFVLCRASVRAVLCEKLGCENRDLVFGSSEWGKPHALVGGERASVEFNVSHSGDHGLVAVSPRGRVGVDVEERRSRMNLEGLVETVFGRQERALLAGLEGERWLEAFLRLWTIKEALAKAWGMGLRTDFSRFQTPVEMRAGNRTGLFRRPAVSNATWRVQDIGNGDMAAAVACEIGSGPVSLD